MRARAPDHGGRRTDRFDEVLQHGRADDRRHATGGRTAPSAADRLDPKAIGSRRKRPRGARRLEHHQFVRAESEHRPSGCTDRESRRRVVADHVVRVAAILQAKRDAQIGVRADVVGDHSGRTLRRQQQVDAQTAATLGNRHERAQEVGQFLGERRELVDHHHETWQRIIDHPAIAREIVDSGRSQEALTAPHFGIEADEYPFGQAVVEVGHHPNGVRQPGTGIERRAALEVDQDHREMVGAGPRGERHHQRAQELALAGSRRAGDQTVGPIAHQVDVDDAVAGQPEPSDRCRVTPGLHPAASDHRRGVVSRWFEIGQRHVRRHAACAVVVLGVDQRRQPSCCGLRGRR